MVQTDNNKAITSMVLGIVSVVLSWVPVVGSVCGILGIVFYTKSNKLIKANPHRYGGHGMALAGLITGIAGLAFSLIYLVYWIFILFIIGAALSGGTAFA